MQEISFAPEDRDIVRPLLLWFRKTARDLPWRSTYDPYHVWISEIMLQQTQMDRGVVYFKRWIHRFPTACEVADADLQEILKYWEGLGYYTRARNLHKAAQVIVGDFKGLVPCDYHQLMTLPGIGPYTAAAIASVAGNQDVAVIDANVTRVFARLFDMDMPVKESLTQKRIAVMARNLLPPGKARLYNQALMDLGGLVCLPKNPCCAVCPLAHLCKAQQAGTVAQRPVVSAGKKIVTVHKVAGIIRHGDRIFIQQRPQEAVWGGLWEFPGGELQDGVPDKELVRYILAETGLSVRVIRPVTKVVHHYTRYKIVLQAFYCELLGQNTEVTLRSAVDFRWLLPSALGQYAFPAGPRKILEHLKATSLSFFA
ncbi:MAG: A/G-specific adenine glycosylase [Pseudomonadota bacterium]